MRSAPFKGAPLASRRNPREEDLYFHLTFRFINFQKSYYWLSLETREINDGLIKNGPPFETGKACCHPQVVGKQYE